MSSNELCKACSLLEGLERGVPQAAIVSQIPRRASAPLTLISRRIEPAKSWQVGVKLQRTCGLFLISKDLVLRHPALLYHSTQIVSSSLWCICLLWT